MARTFANIIDVCLLRDRLSLKAKTMEFMVKGYGRHAGAIFVVVELLNFGRLVPPATTS